MRGGEHAKRRAGRTALVTGGARGLGLEIGRQLDEDILRAPLDTSLAGTGVLVGAADLGWTRSGMGGPSAPRGPEEGADTPVRPAALPDGDATTAGLFAGRRPLPR
ncbi:hypothetical protein AB0M11_01570 [Streptomyces sp. NPDC051987]|uniref:hypothetical protein n=1 Tax=Streptomyces sp. NPDC051987 TaxID=3155808 RepID=UPI00342D4DBC